MLRSNLSARTSGVALARAEPLVREFHLQYTTPLKHVHVCPLALVQVARFDAAGQRSFASQMKAETLELRLELPPGVEALLDDPPVLLARPPRG